MADPERRRLSISRKRPGSAGLLTGAARRLSVLPPAGWATALALAALVVRLPLILTEHGTTPGGDSAAYLSIASTIGAGDGVAGAYRTPGYPMFILALDAVPGRREDAVVIAQHLLAVILVASVVMVAWRIFGRATALLAGSMLAVTPTLPYLEHAILTDFVFAVLITLLAALLGRALLEGRPTMRALIGVGVVCAAAAYVRPVGQFMLLGVLVAAALATRSVRETARATAIVLATFALLVAPWIVRNAVQYDTVSMSVVGGDTLFVRAFEVDRLPIPTDSPVGQLASDVAATRGETRTVTAVTLALQEQGVGRLETLRAQQSLAQQAISRDPWVFAKGTVREMAALRLDARDVSVGTDVGPHLPDPPRLTAAIWGASDALSAVWWILSLHMVAGLLLLVAPDRRIRIMGGALVSVWFAVALATALSRGALTRYSLELAPLSFLIGSYGAVVVGSAIFRQLARGRVFPPSFRPGDAEQRA